MLEAFSAEALKIRHHKATWFLVWAYPILFGAVFVLAVILGLAGIDEQTDPQTSAAFMEDTILIWIVPAQTFGRYLIAAFIAVVFAGEYGWNTWKLVVPHRSRPALIAAKYGVVLSLLLAAFLATAAISTAGAFAKYWSTGDVVPAGVTASALLHNHVAYALAAIAPLFVTLGYASLAAVLTRSTIAALVISLVTVTLEQLLFSFAPGLSLRFDAIIDVLHPVLPGYHLSNISEWVREGVGLTTKFPDGEVVAMSLGTSIAAAAAWVIALFGLTFVAFKRQDIN
jgi:ABC-type transport system involved in multi-copper enzyme maturation permease subunit